MDAMMMMRKKGRKEERRGEGRRGGGGGGRDCGRGLGLVLVVGHRKTSE